MTAEGTEVVTQADAGAAKAGWGGEGGAADACLRDATLTPTVDSSN